MIFMVYSCIICPLISDTIKRKKGLNQRRFPLSNRIYELRREKKMTQLQLSIALGVTQETISSYEHDRHLPSLTALITMSEIFDASMDYIMGLSNVRPIARENENIEEHSQQIILLNFYKMLGSKNKARLIAYAQGLLDSQKD